MANLIIKPTTGGSLILQDEGGDAALTVGTTGVSTIANATITTGTIAAAVTFPTGSVVKTSSLYHDNGGVQDSVTGTGWEEINSNLRLAHTAASATNILLMNFSISFNSPSSNNIYHCKFYNQSGSADLTIATAAGSRARPHWTTRVTASDVNDFFTMNMMLRHVAGSTSAITYSPYFMSPSGADIDFFRTDLDASSGFTSGGTFIITEIQA